MGADRRRDADLVVVGCGPVGVMAALRARQFGLSVIAIDRDIDVYPLPRAIGIHDEIQRLFYTAGLGEALGACSTPMPGAEFVNAGGERVVGVDFGPDAVGPNGHHPAISFDQPSLERALRRAAVGAGVELLLGVEVMAIDGATITCADGTVVSGRWVIGADGARSTVRKLLDITLEDQGFDEAWVVVDTTLLDPDLPLPRYTTQHCDPERIVTFVPGHDRRRRWEFQLRAGETADEMGEPERVADLLAPWGGPEALRIDRTAVYRFHATVAERMRIGDVFLAGDAAHQMPPFNGQGMCSGMRDADNLIWKLAAVQHGTADERLLDSYDIERRAHAAGQVRHSADAGRLINAIAAGDAVAVEAGYGGGRGFPRFEAGLVEPGHRAVGRPMPQPTIDDVPLDRLMGDGFALVTAPATTIPPGLRDRWAAIGARRVDVDPAALPGLLSDSNVIVVRPDRHVAAVSDDLATTTDHLARLGLRL